MGLHVRQSKHSILCAMLQGRGRQHGEGLALLRSKGYWKALQGPVATGQLRFGGCCTVPYIIYLSGTFVLCQHGANSHFFRFFSTFGLMHQNVVPLGGGMCILFEICEKRPFQKCMGWGGIGDYIFECRGRTFRRFRVFGPQPAPLTRAGHQLTGFPLGAPTYCGVGAK